MHIIKINQNDNIDEVLSTFKAKSVKLILSPGIYNQKITITLDNLIIEGMNPNSVIITYHDHATMIHKDGRDYGTFRTPTLTIMSDNVTIRNITIKNDAGVGVEVGQAVAMAVYGNHLYCENVRLEGNQDTLFLSPLPEYPKAKNTSYLSTNQLHSNHIHAHFKHSSITGNIDFIFGSATALFDSCDIIATGKGYIAAPSTHERFKFGFIFKDCNIINKSIHEIYLARPWRNHGSVIFLNCTYSGLIHKDRFSDWHKDTYRFYEYPYVPSPFTINIHEKLLEELFHYIETYFNN